MTTMTHSGKATVTLQGDRDILIEREFDAPKHLVFEAITKPEHVRLWWGAGHGDVTECEADLRVGGKWRYVMRAGSDTEVGFHGEYRELEPNDRIVSTELFEAPFLTEEDASVNTITLTELDDGRTHLAALCQYRLPEHRDGVIESGMEGGMQQSYDALEKVAQSLR